MGRTLTSSAMTLTILALTAAAVALVFASEGYTHFIIALVALYRPGPMANIPTYCARKHGDEEPEYLHPLLEPILKETFGVIIYQEQVMQIAQVMAGYSLGEADLLRRAMGKKIRSEMEKQRERFVAGSLKTGVPKGQAETIFELLAKFADYGFNSYSTVIQTRREIVDGKADMVQRFVDASIIGWYNYLYGDNRAANELIKGDNPQTTDDQLAHSVATMKEYGIVDSGDARSSASAP